ncbi:hypothetical protein GC102_35465 [Paenibacillus sp. LMG 31460]|uniref:Uncharacterized protein n=1 Tax=Paenibacillus germinis TaxID=2654979 RepID=A0ABX1ZD23_9BACL|nr:hypothetical protein [Paenibacillus germinis]NOU90987.1 hypothetical protein [Paenibacillus germinis]
MLRRALAYACMFVALFALLPVIGYADGDQPPVITTDQTSITVQESVYSIAGSVSEQAVVTVNGTTTELGVDLTFIQSVNLQQGINTIVIEAKNGDGLQAEPLVITVDYIPVMAYEYGNALFGEGGWITGLVFHPQEELKYIRTDVGGTYRMDETQQQWIPLNDDLPYSLWTWYSVDGIAVDPNDPNVVYAAVGLASNAQNSYRKGTVFKSGDKGESWTPLPLELNFSGNGDLRWVGERIGVDPFDSARIWVSSRQEGLWVSEDGGQSWSLSAFPGILTDNYGVTVLLFDRHHQGVVYAAAYEDGIYRSNDSGDSWVKLAGSDNPDKPARMVLSASGALYVTTENHGKGVLKYESGIWINLTPDSNMTNFSDEPAGYNGISINPFNEQSIIVSPHNMGGVLFRTEDGGNIWTRIDSSNSVLQSDIPWMKPAYWAASIGALEFDPYHNNQVWFTDWHGIWKTEDITAETIQWEQIQQGHEEMTTRSVKSIPQQTRLAIGGADMGGGISYHYDEYPERIDNLGMSEIYDWDFLESDPSQLVMVGGSKVSGLGAVSHDSGDTWTKFPAYPVIGGLPTKVAMSATDPSLFLVTTSDYSVFRTADGGSTWTEIFDIPVTAKGPWTWSNVLKSDRVNGNKFYFIDYKTGDVYRSTNGGLNFTKTVTLPLPEDRRWIYMQPSFHSEGELWISLDDKGLYRSIDSGSTFIRVDRVDQAFNIALGKPAAGSWDPAVYMYGTIGGIEGMFRSLDNGQSWQDIDKGDTGFGNRPQTMDASKQVFGLVFVGTTGRGVRYGKVENSDIIPPKIHLNQENLIVNHAQFEVSGSANENATIMIQGNPVPVDNDMGFTGQVILQPGDNVITVQATDNYGNSFIKRLHVIYDSVAPALTLDQTHATVRQAEFIISGTLNERGSVSIDGHSYSTSDDLAFISTVTLQSGMNSVLVTPVDEAGNQGTPVSLNIEYVPIPSFDLVLTEIGVEEASYQEGDNVHLYAIVKNQGNEATPLQYVMVHFVKNHDYAIERSGGSGTKWYPSGGNQSSTSLSIATSNLQLSIAPGESIRFTSGTYNVPMGQSHFKLLAIADATSKFLATEEDRTNNTLASMVSSSLVTEFSIGTQVGASVIDAVYRRIDFQLNVNSQNKFLKPTIGLMPGSTIAPQSGAYMNFGSPVAYIVTTANGVKQMWTAANTLTANLPSPYFDLVVTEVGVDDSDYAPGDEVRFYAVIENKGNIPSPLQYVNVHFVVGASTALEKGDKKWYPDGGNLSSTALRSGDKNVYVSILPGAENAIKVYASGTYTILERRQSFNLLSIVDASGKFFDTEPNRRNNYKASVVSNSN